MHATRIAAALALTIGSVSLGALSIDSLSIDSGTSRLSTETEPRFDEQGRLLRPVGWQKWILAGSSLGLGYTPRTRGEDPGTFKHVYITPESFDHYAQTGEIRDKTMLVLAAYSSEDRAAPAENGWYPGTLRAIEVAVKDEGRFEGGWGYFDVGTNEDRAAAEAFPQQRCAACHAEHAAVDNVFVQFYPVLRDSRAAFEKGR